MAEAAETDAKIVAHLNEEPFHRGEMPINEQTSTYHVFDNLWRWGSVAMATIMLFLVLMFCTKAGFIGAAIPAVIVFAAGFFLVKKPTSLETH